MKRNFIPMIIALLFSASLSGQPLTGIKTIPGDFASIKLAVSSLNANGVGPGGVTFNIASGYKESFTSPDAGYITTTTGSAANPVVFRRSGSGENPIITAASGTGDMDAIFLVAGCDFVTFENLDIRESDKNQDPLTQMEWGFAILKAGGNDGSQDITIKNCNVLLDSNNLLGAGIYVNNHTAGSPTTLVVTSPAGTNSNLKIFGNHITNAYNGIYLQGYSAPAPYTLYDQNNEIGKDGANVITHIGGSDVVCYGIYASSQNNLKVAGNTVTSSMGGDKNVYGIYLTSSTNASYDLYGNTVTINYNSWDGNNANLFGIYTTMGASGTSNTVNIYNNSVTNCTMPNMESAQFYGIYAYNLGVDASVYGNVVSNNTIGSTGATAIGLIRYLWMQKISSVPGPLVAHHNSVTGNTRLQAYQGDGSTFMLSIVGNGSTLDAYDNLVSNNVVNSNWSTHCLYVTFSDVTYKKVYNNTISDITGANGSVVGLYNSGGTLGYIYNNRVQGISAGPFASSAVITGINHNSGTTMYYYNNMISELTTQATSGTLGYDYNMLSGIYVESGGTVKGFYNNTVFINSPSQAADFGSSAFCAATLGGVDLRNNIFVNTSTANGPNGKTVAIRSRSTSLGSYTSNYNNVYAGVPGPSNLVFTNGVIASQTLAQYQASTSTDQQSVTELPPFVNVTTSPYNIHLSGTIATKCESGGTIMGNPIAVPTDFDNDARYPNPGYPVNPAYPPAAPDLGADEFGGRPIDALPPTINYTPLSDINHGNSRTLEVIITDPSGVPQSGFGLPMLYWRKNGGAYLPVQGVYTGNDTYTFVFGGGSVLNDIIEYYVVAQDMISPFPNVGAFPVQGASGYSANPPACSTPPANPSSYKVIMEISGVKHIGIGKDYATITAAAADLNLKYMSGPVTFILDDATYPSETFPVRFNHRPGNSPVNTLTLRPNTGTNTVITGNSSGQGILVMNGIDYCTIDGSNSGGTGKNLTIENTSNAANSSVLSITNNNGTNPSTFITIKNCRVIGAKTTNPYISTYCILFNHNGGVSGGGYNNCQITGNEIKKARCGMLILGSLNNINRNISITGNTFGSADTTYYLGQFGLTVEMSDNTLISGNEIIGPATGSIFGNMFGILYYNNCSNTKIHNNSIHDWNTFDLGSYGIKCSNDNDATPTEIYNNLIYNISTPGLNPGVANNNAYGIFIRWGGNIRIWHNTIYMNGPYLSGFDPQAPSSACLGFYEQSTNNFDIRGNIFRNSMTNPMNPPAGSGNMGRAYAIQFTGPVTKFSHLDHNDYFINGYHAAIAQHWGSGTGPIAEIDSLSGWQAYTGQEAHALALNPVFISDVNPMNLRPTNIGINSVGGPKVLDTDYDGFPRFDPSDMGAYEWSKVITEYHTLPATDVTETTAVLNGDINTMGEVVDVVFDYGTSNNYSFTAFPSPSTVRTAGNLLSLNAAINGLQPGTTYSFRFRGVSKTSGQDTLFGANLFFTTGSGIPANITVGDTVTGTQCFNATDTITVAGNGTTFVVENGGSATFIAGQSIKYLPGTTVKPGGYMHGYITLTNEYCNLMNPVVNNPATLTGKPTETPYPMNDRPARLYPNPATNDITIEFNSEGVFSGATAEVYGINGLKAMPDLRLEARSNRIDVGNLYPGLYFIHIRIGDTIETLKMIKL